MKRAYVVPGNPSLVCLAAENGTMVYITCDTETAARSLVATLLDHAARVEVIV